MSYGKGTCILLAAATLSLVACAEPFPYQAAYPDPSYPSYPNNEIARYGYVESIETIAPERSSTMPGVGAIGGAVVGGLIGHQIGSGSGNTAATIGGAVIGGVAGHQVEQHVRGRQQVAGVEYVIRVRMDDGSYQTFRQEVQYTVQVGDRVRVERGNIFRV